MQDPRLAGSTVLVKQAIADTSTLSQLLATQPPSRSRSLPPAFRKRDSTARIQHGTRKQGTEETLEELERRLTYLHEKQAAYDDYAARPRNIKRPDSRAERINFQRRVEEALGPNDAKEDAQQRIDVYEAMVAQKAAQRHFEWTNNVFKPITSAVATAVDAQKGKITATRRRAYDDYLKATATRKGVFLDDTLSDYDPYTVARNSIRVAVPVEAADPTKTLSYKARSERAIMDPEGSRALKNLHMRDTLPPPQWTDMAMESTMHGHFEMKEAAGEFTMAFAGRDTASTVRFDLDFNNQLTMTSKGRVAETDAEFPPGKKMDYPYRYQPTLPVLKHISMSGVYEKGDRPFTDDAYEDVRPHVTRAALGGAPKPPLFGRVYQIQREVAAANKAPE